jgi:hypothetical protein
MASGSLERLQERHMHLAEGTLTLTQPWWDLPFCKRVYLPSTFPLSIVVKLVPIEHSLQVKVPRSQSKVEYNFDNDRASRYTNKDAALDRHRGSTSKIY